MEREKYIVFDFTKTFVEGFYKKYNELIKLNTSNNDICHLQTYFKNYLKSEHDILFEPIKYIINEFELIEKILIKDQNESISDEVEYSIYLFNIYNNFYINVPKSIYFSYIELYDKIAEPKQKQKEEPKKEPKKEYEEILNEIRSLKLLMQTKMTYYIKHYHSNKDIIKSET